MFVFYSVASESIFISYVCVSNTQFVESFSISTRFREKEILNASWDVVKY